MGSAREMAIIWSLLMLIGVWQWNQVSGVSGRVQTILSPEYSQSDIQLLDAVRKIKASDWQALPEGMEMPDGAYSATNLPDGVRWTLVVEGKPFADITARIEDGWFSDRQVWFDFTLRPSGHSPEATAAIQKMPMPHDLVQVTGDYMLGDILRIKRDHLPTLDAAQAGIMAGSPFVAGRYIKYMAMHKGVPMRGSMMGSSF